MKDLLPIGSVVTLKEGTKRLMIIGRLQQNVRTKKVYDYAGCLWPEGYMDKEHCYVFNHDEKKQANRHLSIGVLLVFRFCKIRSRN